MAYFVGLDWGSAAHSACVVDSNGAVVAQLDAEHDAAGLSRLLGALKKVGPAAELPVAIERPDGLLVDTLVHAGHPIVPIHPNVLKASRPRYRAARSKSDPGDAHILADMLRTDGHRFERLTPDSDGSRALRALVRTREDLVQERVRTVNRVRALLDTYWPGAGALFADVDSQISLAFLKRYPTPTSARRLSAKQLAGFLKAHSYPGRRNADELIKRLRAAPVGPDPRACQDPDGVGVRATASARPGVYICGPSRGVSRVVGPLRQRHAQAHVAGVSEAHDPALARLVRDRGHAGLGSELRFRLEALAARHGAAKPFLQAA